MQSLQRAALLFFLTVPVLTGCSLVEHRETVQLHNAPQEQQLEFWYQQNDNLTDRQLRYWGFDFLLFPADAVFGPIMVNIEHQVRVRYGVLGYLMGVLPLVTVSPTGPPTLWHENHLQGLIAPHTEAILAAQDEDALCDLLSSLLAVEVREARLVATGGTASSE